jgi:sporulation protein YlmC with PRC-barrel domain
MMTSSKDELDLPIKARVYAGGESCGETVCVVVNPASERVTDVVVELSGGHARQVLVPLHNIRAVKGNQIELDLDCEDVRRLPVFKRTDFFEVEVPVGFAGGPFVMWPYVVPELRRVPIDTEMVPPDELAIHRGAEVISNQGPVGKVDEFLIDPESEQITHLVMHEGHLWGQRDVLIPVASIKRMDDDEVHVKLDKAEIEALPQIPVHRDDHWSRPKK